MAIEVTQRLFAPALFKKHASPVLIHTYAERASLVSDGGHTALAASAGRRAQKPCDSFDGMQ